MACPMRRERKPSPDARPGHPPAHTRTVIAYTTTRDAILLAEEMVEDVYSLPRQVVGDGDLFALKLERRRVRCGAPCGSCGCSCRSGLRVDASLDRVGI